MRFRSGKPLANVWLVLLFYLAIRLAQKINSDQRPSARSLLGLWVTLFLGFFWDETALFSFVVGELGSEPLPKRNEEACSGGLLFFYY